MKASNQERENDTAIAVGFCGAFLLLFLALGCDSTQRGETYGKRPAPQPAQNHDHIFAIGEVVKIKVSGHRAQVLGLVRAEEKYNNYQCRTLEAGKYVMEVFNEIELEKIPKE